MSAIYGQDINTIMKELYVGGILVTDKCFEKLIDAITLYIEKITIVSLATGG